MFLLRQFISECQTRAPFWALEGVPLPATLSLLESEDDVYTRIATLLVLQMKELGEWAEATEQVLMPAFYRCGT